MKKFISVMLILIIILNVFIPMLSFGNSENNITGDEYYYSSLSLAIRDANNNTTENADSNSNQGVAGVIINENKVDIKLLKDCEEENELIISNNIDLNLNGKKLNLKANSSEEGYGFVINKYKTLSVYGDVEGSEIFHNESLGKQFYMFQVIGSLNINGGKYVLNVNDNRGWFINATDTSLHTISVENIQLAINASKSAIGIRTSVVTNNSKIIFKNNKCELNCIEKIAVTIQGRNNLIFQNNEVKLDSQKSSVYGIYSDIYSDLVINNNQITVNSENGDTYGIIIQKDCITKMSNNEILSDSIGGSAYGIYSFGKNSLIENLSLKVISRAKNDKHNIGIRNALGKMIVKESNIICDSPSNNYGSSENRTTTSTGISSYGGELNLYDVNVKTTDYGVLPSQDAKLYVKGGTFEAFGHGPLYLANGHGENYIEDATIIGRNKSQYDGEFDTSEWTEIINSCMYMGGGSNESNSGVSAYVNNCIFDDEGTYYGYYVLRGTDGEHDLKLYISNTTFKCGEEESSDKFRIDNGTDHVYYGTGNSWPDVNHYSRLKEGVTAENNIHYTEEVYKKSDVTYLKLGNSDYKKVYVSGEKFDKTKLELIFINENGEENIISNYEIIDENAELIEEQEYVTIRYNELELQVPIKVFSDENYDLIIGKDIYGALDDIISNVCYLEEADKYRVRCIVKKEAIDNLTKLDLSEIENEIDYSDLEIFHNLKELDLSNKKINKQEEAFTTICKLEKLEQLKLINCLFNNEYEPNTELIKNVMILPNLQLIDFGEQIQNSNGNITNRRYNLPNYLTNDDKDKIEVKCTYKNNENENVIEDLPIYTNEDNSLFIIHDMMVSENKKYGQRLISINILTGKIKKDIRYFYNWELDIDKPIVNITGEPLTTFIENSQQVSKTNSNSVIYTFTWNEDVFCFSKDSITVENGTKDEINEIVPNKVYTLVVTNEVEENQEIIQNIIINENVCTDFVGNGNVKSEKKVIIDKKTPVTGIEKLYVEVKNYEEVEESGTKYIERVLPNTSIEELMKNIETNGTTVELYKGNEKITDASKLIATGMEIVIKLGEQEDRYTVVVKGDVTGDGEIGIGDLLKLSRFESKMDKDLTGAYLRASDVVENGLYAGISNILKMSRVIAKLEQL